MRRRDNLAFRARSARGAGIGPASCIVVARRDEDKRGDMVEESCVFCRIIGGEEMVSLVHEDDRTLAFLDIQPMSKGHTLIVTKDHYETLFDLPEDLAAHCLA